MTRMVEKVAIALHELEGGHKWSDASDGEKRSAVRYARAAIEAMLHPTEAMVYAANDHHEGQHYLPYSLFSAMIQAAIKEECQ